ncbi:hypothetical protein MSTO_53180 [Mycobacterium stomatepiae]|uniref:Uncharacterized protein n=1 Tax=Mycobacterium stomatepiae TaxID=470076 RepID=A0A7I7QFN0_9MYCO|nr:hypothetical protein MSTO_53180 [Mycobacterium stomatepiae]
MHGQPGGAIVAATAEIVGQHHVISWGDRGHCAAHLRHDASSLVSEDDWGFIRCGRGDYAQIGVTDARADLAYNQLIGT